MDGTTANLRIRFYGVQGTISTYPSARQRSQIEQERDVALIRRVLDTLAHPSPDIPSVTPLLDESPDGGPGIDRLLKYRDELNVPPTTSYGGWTTCIHVETADGIDIVLDCGSGFRRCARDLQKKWGDRQQRDLHVFGSHSHLDHTEGFHLSDVCFDPRNHIHVYGNHQFLKSLDDHLGVFTHHVADEMFGIQSPVYYGNMSAHFGAIRIGTGPQEDNEPACLLPAEVRPIDEPLALGQTQVTPFAVCHPAPCLAYRIERQGRAFVFCTDHELYRGKDDEDYAHASHQAEERLARHATDADLLYRDGQYLLAEYEGKIGIGGRPAISRVGWGHTCIEDVERAARIWRVGQVYIGHHDPDRDWAQLKLIDQGLHDASQGEKTRCALARAEMQIEI